MRSGVSVAERRGRRRQRAQRSSAVSRVAGEARGDRGFALDGRGMPPASPALRRTSFGRLASGDSADFQAQRGGGRAAVARDGVGRGDARPGGLSRRAWRARARGVPAVTPAAAGVEGRAVALSMQVLIKPGSRNSGQP